MVHRVGREYRFLLPAGNHPNDRHTERLGRSRAVDNTSEGVAAEASVTG